MQDTLKRALGLKEATAINMIDMVGIGPFVVIPLVLQEMNGPYALLAWVAGAVLAVLDGLVWAELGAAFPEAGGSYAFLRKVYHEKKAGKMLSFLFIWQTTLQAPLVVASGAIGFAQYVTYLLPLSPWEQKAVSGLTVVALTALLYRGITAIGKISMVLWIGVTGTILWVIGAGALHFDPAVAFNMSGATGFDGGALFFGALGVASVKTVYTYLGYYNVCHLGSEITEPHKVIPRSILISVAGITVLYLLMNLSIIGAVPWQEAKQSQFVVSLFFERVAGPGAGTFVTVMILWIAFSSLFAVLLGYSRIPYAAALDGNYFSVFARTDERRGVPNVSLLTIAAIAFVFSLLFKMKEVITAILAMRIAIQFIGQTVGLLWYKRGGNRGRFPFSMPLYPLPALLSIGIWLFLFFSTGLPFILGAAGIISLGCAVYLIRARKRDEWPFAER